MGFWARLSNFFRPAKRVERYELITERGNGFYSWNGNLYHSDIVRSCVRPYYKAVGKLVPKHIRQTQDGFRTNPDPYMRMLLKEPNPYMSGQLFQEKMAIQLALNNNAFAAIIRDENGLPMELYPIPAYSVEALYDKQGNLYLRFGLKNGKKVTLSYEDVLHLKQDYNDNDIFGSSPHQALTQLMEIVTVADQGIVKAIKNSAVIKWLLKFNQSLRPEDIKKQTKEFVQSYLSIDSDAAIGAAGIDSKVDAKQVEPKDYVPATEQTEQIVTRIYNLFGTNRKIIQSDYTEDEWNAYYESEIEPTAIRFADEYTRKLFTRRMRGHGNEIIFEATNLQYAAMKTKLELYKMVDRGALTPNEWRRVFNLAPIDGGDTPIRRLDTEEVDNDAED